MSDFIFRQLFDKKTSTYTYLIGDEDSREAVIIDPVIEQFERDCKLIRELNLNLKYSIDTHIHADHITGAYQLKEKLSSEILMPYSCHITGEDRFLHEGNIINLGNSHFLKVISTPGHTQEHICLHLDDRLFTGDTLLIRGCGRTDFQGGSSDELYHSITKKLFKFSDNTLIYPGHDYKGLGVSTVNEEKKFNLRIADKSLEEFKVTMASLKLSSPNNIDYNLKANFKCGIIV